MKISSIKTNFILNTVRLTLGMLFILLTTPYITRILGSENLGKVEYVSSIISYFLLFTALGIPNYGVREVARVRDDEEKLTIVTMELLTILMITTVLGYLVLLVLVKEVEIFRKNNFLFNILGFNLLFTNIGINWFYQGIENQKYITKRFIVTKLIALFLIFIFVKNQDDFKKYAVILVIMESGSNIFNIFNIRKFVKFEFNKIRVLNLKRHIKYILVLFTSSLAISIYLGLDTVMIGSMIGPSSVAYYVLPNKLIRLVLVIVTALGTVMIPRISNSLQNRNRGEYLKYIDISFKYILLIAVPSTISIFILADEIILIMGGIHFFKSVMTLRILSIIILIVGLANFVALQVLFTNGKEKYHTIGVTIAAIINFIFNFIFIPKFHQNGAAFGTILAEIIGLTIFSFLGRSYIKEADVIKKENLKYFISSIPLVVILIIIKTLFKNEFVILIISIILGGLIYFMTLYFQKEKIVFMGKEMIFNKFKKDSQI